MSTDRELLELAAKANGFQVKGWIGDRLSFFDPILDSAEYEWNPLTDDGDALRLAVNLNLDVCIHGCSVDVYSGDLDEEITEIVDHGESLESTRRAIVRAAAEIGRAMP